MLGCPDLPVIEGLVPDPCTEKMCFPQILVIKTPGRGTTQYSKKYMYMDVSKNRGTLKSSILIEFSIINHPFWGTLICWKHPYSKIMDEAWDAHPATLRMASRFGLVRDRTDWKIWTMAKPRLCLWRFGDAANLFDGEEHGRTVVDALSGQRAC